MPVNPRTSRHGWAARRGRHHDPGVGCGWSRRRVAGETSVLCRHSPYEPARTWNSIADGGYSIVTTIDARARQVLEAAADETVAGSAMNGQPANLQAAGVVVEPGTGRVLAYFGGHQGTGNDYAGFYFDESGEAVGVGRYPPGG